MTRDVWQAALRPDISGIVVDNRLFHEAGCRLVHKYSMYKDPFPHPALREGVIPRLLSFVDRAMAIFWRTTYRASDYASPSSAFGVPLNHPRFLEWIGVPESASLLEMGPGQWLDTLSREKAMAVAIQLHRDVCLMTMNLDQYALSLQGAASKMLETSIGYSDYPVADVAAGALGPRVRRASVQMEAMGLWRPSLDPIRLKPEV